MGKESKCGNQKKHVKEQELLGENGETFGK